MAWKREMSTRLRSLSGVRLTLPLRFSYARSQLSCWWLSGRICTVDTNWIWIIQSWDILLRCLSCRDKQHAQRHKARDDKDDKGNKEDLIITKKGMQDFKPEEETSWIFRRYGFQYQDSLTAFLWQIWYYITLHYITLQIFLRWPN